MKTLYLIGGTMGVGKTTVCNRLNEELDKSVFLDGDWCWNANPFQVTDETKEMVMKNICFLLNQFIKCSAYENIVFCWVMHQQSIIDEIISNLDLSCCKIKTISLVCDENTLKERLNKDVKNSIRKADVIERSIERIELYHKINSIKINTSDKNIDELCREISSI